MAQVAHAFAVVGEMIRENTLLDDARADLLQRLAEGFRPADTRESGHIPAPQAVQRQQIVFTLAGQPHRMVPREHHRQVREFALQEGAQVSQPGRVHLVAARQQHSVGPPQSPHRLAQQAPWQQVAVAPRTGRVDQHQIQVASHAVVLESVVQQQQLTFQLINGGFSGFHTVGPLQVGHIRQ